MKNDLDTKMLLRVFEKIQTNGEKNGDEYFLGGVTASSDMDGYTIFMRDAQVSLTFGFHNQYHFESEQHSHVEDFEKKLKAIDADY